MVECGSCEMQACNEPYFLILANELIEYIFNFEILSYIDICRLSGTCHRFHVIANNKEVWKVKAHQRWKLWKHEPHVESDWKGLFRKRLKCNKEILERINDIVSKSFKKDRIENADLKSFGEFCRNQDEECQKQMDNVFYELLSANRFEMLTIKFYSRTIYAYIKQQNLRKKWDELLCKPGNWQNITKGAVLIAQWCMPLEDVCEESIHKEIEEIVSKVKEKVAIREGEQCNQGGNVDQERRILDAIQVVMYQEMGFHGNRKAFYNVNNSYIDKVLKLRTGIPITLSILHGAVAERLGLFLQPVNFQRHFLVRYSPSNASDSCKYIDAFNDGKIMSEQECFETLHNESEHTDQRYRLSSTASPKEVFIRMVANIIFANRSTSSVDGRSTKKLLNALELMLLLSPDDEEHLLMLSQIYLHYGVNLDEVIDILNRLFSSTLGRVRGGVLTYLHENALEKKSREASASTPAKYRSDASNSEVLYYVGLVMHHKRYHYFCVIYGWDNFCDMEEDWRIQMGVYHLTDGATQPFYNVLADDGSCRYASQENLVSLNGAKSPGRPIFHQDVGKYFSEFNGFRYIPNEHLAKLYPEDGEIPRHLLPASGYDKMNETETEEEG